MLVMRVLLGTYHSLLPKFLGWSLSPSRLFFGSIRFLFLLALSLWPIWLKVYEAASATESSLPKATWTQAIVSSLILSFCVCYNFAYDRLSTTTKGKRMKRKLLQHLTNEIRGTITGFSPFIRLKRPESDQEQLRIARRKVLGWIRRVAQVHVADYEGTCIEATLLVFANDNCTTMRIEDRTTDSRPVGRTFSANEIMAYYVAKSAKHRCINDFQKDPHPFPKAGLSLSDPGYRSILLIPLLDMQGGGPDNCLGVVAIDSTRGYCQ
jgi:hypothetical protein